MNINARYAVKLNINGIENVVHFTPQAHGYLAEYQDQNYSIQGQLLDAHHVKIELNGRKTNYAFSLSGSGLTVYDNGQSHHFAHIKPNFNHEDDSADAGNLKAPMPGVITQVLVQPNSQVKKDDVLLTLEAMKIEYSIRAPQDGVVAAAYFQKGDQVKAGDELVEFVALEDVA